SGFGFSGGRPRCFAYWQDFQKCYAGTDNPQTCVAQYADYFECLHRPQEVRYLSNFSHRLLKPTSFLPKQARAKAVEREFFRQAQAVAKEGRKAADVLADGAIVGLGIIQQSQEDKKES
ncbi:NADH dehydrogenase [ubiquinone] iron-sulfur protein 5-B, partial [Leucoagaricus sp. SymC.cos]